MTSSNSLTDKKLLYVLGGLTLGLGALFAINKASKKDKKAKKLTENLIGIEMGGTGSKISIINRRWNTSTNKYDYQVMSRFGVDSTTPEETVSRLLEFIRGQEFTQIGIASFGPVCLNPKDPYFGCITTTPKLQWQNYPLLATVKQKSGCENVFMDTDVNAAALAEYELGNHNVNSLIYVTVGTGVGVGVVVDGKPVHGLTHPEGGHISVSLDPYDQDYEGVCPYHKNCLEGLVSNNSIGKRLGLSTVHDLPTVDKDHKVWEVCANYLAQLCLNITLLVSPEVIILGGGIMNQPTMLSLIHKNFTKLLNNYVDHPKLKEVHTYIKLPTLGMDAGVLGGAVLCKHN